MNKKIVRKWVKMLESGRYAQAKYSLVNYGGYCCLGVGLRACGVKKNRIEDDALIPQRGDRYSRDFSRYANLLGVTRRVQARLAGMNDGTPGKTFPEIAAWIRKYILKEKKA